MALWHLPGVSYHPNSQPRRPLPSPLVALGWKLFASSTDLAEKPRCLETEATQTQLGGVRCQGPTPLTNRWPQRAFLQVSDRMAVIGRTGRGDVPQEIQLLNGHNQARETKGQKELDDGHEAYGPFSGGHGMIQSARLSLFSQPGAQTLELASQVTDA